MFFNSVMLWEHIILYLSLKMFRKQYKSWCCPKRIMIMFINRRSMRWIGKEICMEEKRGFSKRTKSGFLNRKLRCLKVKIILKWISNLQGLLMWTALKFCTVVLLWMYKFGVPTLCFSKGLYFLRSVNINYLTLWSWALLERPPVVRPLDIFPAFHGIRRFNTEFTRALHLFLSLAIPIQSKSPHPTSPRSILILSTHLRLGFPSGLFPSGFPSSHNNHSNIHTNNGFCHNRQVTSTLHHMLVNCNSLSDGI
jgi:hypothetical protein